MFNLPDALAELNNMFFAGLINQDEYQNQIIMLSTY